MTQPEANSVSPLYAALLESLNRTEPVALGMRGGQQHIGVVESIGGGYVTLRMPDGHDRFRHNLVRMEAIDSIDEVLSRKNI
jgi:hypothetical protein